MHTRYFDNRRCIATSVALLLGMLPPASTFADAKAGEKKAELCLLCHKPNNREAWIPTLEGQTREYLIAQVKAFKEKRRANTAMQTNVMTLTDRDIRGIADYFASRKPLRGAYALDGARVARGKVLTEESQCGKCHGLDYSGRKEVPRLAGMEPRYSASQLMAFATGTRSHPAVPAFSSLAQVDATSIAQYLAALE